LEPERKTYQSRQQRHHSDTRKALDPNLCSSLIVRSVTPAQLCQSQSPTSASAGNEDDGRGFSESEESLCKTDRVVFNSSTHDIHAARRSTFHSYRLVAAFFLTG
jgi:hypothetical protein